MNYPRPTIRTLDERLGVYVPPQLPGCPIHGVSGFYGGLDTTCTFVFRHYECGCIFAQEENVQRTHRWRFFIIEKGSLIN